MLAVERCETAVYPSSAPFVKPKAGSSSKAPRDDMELDHLQVHAANLQGLQQQVSELQRLLGNGQSRGGKGNRGGATRSQPSRKGGQIWKF